MQITRQLIQKYVSGNCTPEEARIIREWLDNEKSSDTLPFDIDENMLRQDLELIKSNLDQSMEDDDESESRIRFRRTKYAVAASLLIAVLCGTFYLLTRNRSVSANTIAIHWKRISNTGRDNENLVLSDGSEVTLYPDAAISVPDVTIDRHRRLKMLQGTVFFNVRHDIYSPFTVETGRSVVNVLGTSFTIDRKKSGDVVTLHSGRISFSVPGKPLEILAPGQQISYDSATDNIRIAQVEEQRGQQIDMKFNDVPLQTVFNNMETKFDIRIELKNASIGNLRYIGNLNGKSLEDVEDILSLSAGIHFREDGNTITVTN